MTQRSLFEVSRNSDLFIRDITNERRESNALGALIAESVSDEALDKRVLG